MPNLDHIGIAGEMVGIYQRVQNGIEFAALVSVHPLMSFVPEEVEFFWELIDAAFDAGTMEEREEKGDVAFDAGMTKGKEDEKADAVQPE